MTLSNILKPGLKGVFYGRHSTDKQEMIMQRNSVENMVKKYNCEIVDEFMDPGVSATKKKINQRSALKKLLKAADENKFDFVAVYASDRLARNPIEHQQIRMTMRIYGIPIIESRNERLYDSGEDELIVQLLYDGLSKFEADNIRIRTRDGLISRAKNGHWTGGKAPYGYRYNSKQHKFFQYPEEITIVQNIFNLYMKGEGFHAISKQLPLKANKGKVWTKDKVKGIITNPFYAGYLSWGKRTSKSKNSFVDRESWILVQSHYIEPAITKEKWEYCWQLYIQKKNRKLTPKQFKTSFLLKDILVCKHCKCHLTTKDQTTTSNTGKKYGSKIYQCKQCNVRIESDNIHNYVITRILNDIRLSDPKHIQESVIESFNKDIESLQEKVKVLQDALTNYEKQLNNLKIEIQKLMTSDINEHQRKLISALTIYRMELNNRITLTQDFTKETSQKIVSLQELHSNQYTWETTISNAFKSPDNLEQTDIRRLLIQVVEQIEVDKKLNVSYKIRNNLKKQKVDEQIEFSF